MDGTQDLQPLVRRRGPAGGRAEVSPEHRPNRLEGARRSHARLLHRAGLVALVGGLAAVVSSGVSPQAGHAAQSAAGFGIHAASIARSTAAPAPNTTAPTVSSSRHVTPASASGSTLYSWGYFGSHGRLGGLNDSPTPVSGIPGTIKEIATSNSDTYVLTTDGTVWAFGANQYGELGNGSTAPPSSYLTPVQVDLPAGIKIAHLADPMPYDTAIVIDTNGHAWGWGYDGGADLCLGKADVLLSPTELPFSEVSLAAGAGHHASYDSDNTLYACGDNQFGQLGTGTTKDAHRPKAVQGLPGGQIAVLESSYDRPVCSSPTARTTTGVSTTSAISGTARPSTVRFPCWWAWRSP